MFWRLLVRRTGKPVAAGDIVVSKKTGKPFKVSKMLGKPPSHGGDPGKIIVEALTSGESKEEKRDTKALFLQKSPVDFDLEWLRGPYRGFRG